MKKALIIPLLLLASLFSNAQFIYKIKADSVLITNDSCNAELNLENSTKDTIGFLYNKGKGRTEFRRGFIKLNDSLYIIGNDTLNIAKSVGGNYIRNQNAAVQTANYKISGIATSNQVWTDRVFHSNGQSGIRFSRFNNTYEEHFFNNIFTRSITFAVISDIAFLQALTDSGTPWQRLVLSVYPTGHIDFQPSVALNKNIRFNKNGNVNIGDSTDLGHKLQVNGKSLFRDTIRSITPLISNAAGYDIIVRKRTDSAFYRLPFDSIPKSLTATSTLNFASTAAQNSSDLTITVTGATDGDAVSLGVPNASVNNNSSFSAWVSAANTVTVRFNNYSSAAIDPASGTFRVSVIKY